jgi:hypothetical protein
VKTILHCGSDCWPSNSIKFERFSPKFCAVHTLVGVQSARLSLVGFWSGCRRRATKWSAALIAVEFSLVNYNSHTVSTLQCSHRKQMIDFRPKMSIYRLHWEALVYARQLSYWASRRRRQEKIFSESRNNF